MAEDADPSRKNPFTSEYTNSAQGQLALAGTGGAHHAGTYLTKEDEEEEELRHKEERERGDLFFHLTLEELREQLEEQYKDLQKKIEENRRHMEEIDREIERLDREIIKESEQITRLHTERSELEEENERLKERQAEIKARHEHIQQHIAEAERGLMNGLETLNPEAEAAGKAIMEVAQSRVIIEAKIKGDTDDNYRFHPVFKDADGGLYIRHPSKGRTALTALESPVSEITDLEKHARHQETYGEKSFLSEDSAEDPAVAHSYYKNLTEFYALLSADSDNAEFMKSFREQHRELERDVYQFHELAEKKLEIEEQIEQNRQKIERIDEELRERTQTLDALKEKKDRLAEERARLEQETREMERRANEIEKQLKAIDSDVERQVEAIERYGKIHAPEGFYEQMANERYSGCMPTLGSPEEVLRAAKTFDAAIKDMALANTAMDATGKALAAHESRYAQICEKYGDDTGEMAAAVLTTKDANGKDVPVYRNDKTGSLYTLGEDGSKAVIRDVKTIAALTLEAYAEGKLFANEAEAMSCGDIPPEMLSAQVFEKWSQASHKTASKNIVRAAENFGRLTQAPEETPGQVQESGHNASLSGTFKDAAEAAEPAGNMPPPSAPPTPSTGIQRNTLSQTNG